MSTQPTGSHPRQPDLPRTASEVLDEIDLILMQAVSKDQTAERTLLHIIQTIDLWRAQHGLQP